MKPKLFLPKENVHKVMITVLASVLGLVIVVVGSLALGARSVDFSEVLKALLNNDGSLDHLVVMERIPRTLFGLLAGGSLGLSGLLMQSITRNPIADPSILGVNVGAALAVVVGIAFFDIGSPSAYILWALVGAAVTAFMVYGIGSLGRGGATPIKLALAGAAVSAALSSLVSAVILPRTEVMNAYRFWQVGSIGGATYEGMISILPYIAMGILCGVLIMPGLSAMALGDEMAVGLGVRTGVIRLVGALAGVMLCGAITALAGPIGFVGLMVPHIMRMIYGPNLRIVMPMSFVGGAILLLAADVIGRVIGSPSELEAGIVTAFIGAPILIVIARKVKVASL